MSNEYTPDIWVVLKIDDSKGNLTYKVFAGWYGGYLHGDTWQLSSGILTINEDEDHYYLLQHSGSLYICHKDKEHMSFYMKNILTHWSTGLLIQGTTVDVVPIDSLPKPFKE